jgi:hypothetical protein
MGFSSGTWRAAQGRAARGKERRGPYQSASDGGARTARQRLSVEAFTGLGKMAALVGQLDGGWQYRAWKTLGRGRAGRGAARVGRQTGGARGDPRRKRPPGATHRAEERLEDARQLGVTGGEVDEGQRRGRGDEQAGEEGRERIGEEGARAVASVAAEEVCDGGHERRHGLRRGCGEDGRREGGRVDLPRHLAAVGVGFSGDFGDGGDKRARPGNGLSETSLLGLRLQTVPVGAPSPFTPPRARQTCHPRQPIGA